MQQKLEEIKRVIEELEYECKLIERGDLSPIDMILVSIEEEESDFAVSILPLSEELEGSYFIQFYYEYPFEISREIYDTTSAKIHNTNRLLPLGHFNFTISGIQVYYKYVFALPENSAITETNFSDIIDMIVYSVSSFKSILVGEE